MNVLHSNFFLFILGQDGDILGQEGDILGQDGAILGQDGVILGQEGDIIAIRTEQLHSTRYMEK